MITEIKKKRTKFGCVISYTNNSTQEENLLSHTAVSAYVIVHKVGSNNDQGFGKIVMGYRSTPKFKSIIGHYLQQIRGGEAVVLIRPDTNILEDGARIFKYLDDNRIERAFALWVGSTDKPVAIVISSTLMEHLFHAIPDTMDMDADWIGFTDLWLKKSLFGGRYIDGNTLVGIATKEVVPAEEYIIEPDPVAADAGPAVEVAVFEEPAIEVVAKRKPGRPKKAK